MVSSLHDNSQVAINRLKVLIGQGSEPDADRLRDALPERAFDVHVAVNAHQVVEIVTQVPIDLYFIDLDIPSLGGIATLQMVRQIRRPVHAVLTVQRGSKESLLEAADAEVFTHISKPFDSREVRFVIQRFLNKFYGMVPLLLIGIAF